MRISKKWIAGITFTVGFLGVSSCKDNADPVGVRVPTIRMIEGSLPFGMTYGVGGGPTNLEPESGGRPIGSTGVILPPGTVARIHASGDLSLTRNPECDNVVSGVFLSPLPPYGGDASGSGRVRLYLAGQLNNPLDWSFDGNAPVMYVGPYAGDSAIALMVSRQGMPSGCFVKDRPWPLDPIATYEYDIGGSTTLTFDILAVNVVPSSTTVPSGQTVHFSTTPINFASTSGSITWAFETGGADGTIPIPGCATLLVCDYIPTKSGYMEVCMNDEQNHLICGWSPPINVIKCPTGDSILDNPVFRSALLQALKDSHADTIPADYRREVGGYAIYDSTGLHVVRSEIAILSTPCSMKFTAAANAILFFHVHPLDPGEGLSAPEKFPSVCQPTGGNLYYSMKFGGPSPEDWRVSVDQHKPEYIIDKKRIYRTNPLVTDSTKWADSTKRYDWNTRKCKW